MATPLYIPATFHNGVNTAQILIPFVDVFPTLITKQVVILSEQNGVNEPGMYVYYEQVWKFAMPMEAVSLIILNGEDVAVYINVQATINLPVSNVVYKNGQLQPDDTLVPGTAIYGVRQPQAVGPVTSVNNQTGDVMVVGSVVPSGEGVGLVYQTVLPEVKLKDLIAGTNITIVDNGVGGLTISSVGGVSSITLTGDVTGTGTDTINTTLAPSGVVAGTYTKVTVDAKGRVTLGQNPTTLAGFGITDALPITGGSMMGNITMTGGTTVKGIPLPLVDDDVASKLYVDQSVGDAINGVAWHEAVKVATTPAGGTITLNGLQTIDGYALQAGDRILVKDQGPQTQNGVYVAAAGVWARATAEDTGAEILNMATLVLNGTENGLTQWTNSNTTEPVVGVDPITYAQLRSTASLYTAGPGLTLTGLAFSITPTGVSPGIYQSVTVNSLGQVIAGGNISALDVNTALGYTAYDGATNSEGFLKTVTLSGDATGVSEAVTGNLAVELAASGTDEGIFTKVTVDAKGRVVVGDNLTDTDIYTILGYQPVNREGDKMEGGLDFADPDIIGASSITNIGARPTNVVYISTGTGTIGAFDNAPSGKFKILRFLNEITITYNPTSLILPSEMDIETRVNDTAIFLSLGGNNWTCVAYQRADGTALVAGTGSIFTTTQEFRGSATELGTKITSAQEALRVQQSAISVNQNIYLNLGHAWYFTGNASNNWNVNVAMSSSTPLGNVMDDESAITVAVMATQGATAFFPLTFKIDGVTQTVKWLGGTAPAAGNPLGIDVYTYTIVNTDFGYIVLGAQSRYK